MGKILLIGRGGNLKASIGSLMQKEQKEIVVIDSPESLDSLMKDKSINFNEPIPIVNHYKDLPKISTYGAGKEFTCKGKHEYRKHNGEWICQCGRKL